MYFSSFLLIQRQTTESSFQGLIKYYCIVLKSVIQQSTSLESEGGVAWLIVSVTAASVCLPHAMAVVQQKGCLSLPRDTEAAWPIWFWNLGGPDTSTAGMISLLTDVSNVCQYKLAGGCYSTTNVSNVCPYKLAFVCSVFHHWCTSCMPV